jgi:predicted nucleic acid-binding protein
VLVVDTNILVYAADADSDWHGKCSEWIERRRRRPDAWYVTWSIVYEFMRVTTHPRILRKPWNARQAMGFLSVLLASPGLGVLVARSMLLTPSPMPPHERHGPRMMRFYARSRR